jgi:hypothetical protein
MNCKELGVKWSCSPWDLLQGTVKLIIIALRAEIRTGYFPNASQKCYLLSQRKSNDDDDDDDDDDDKSANWSRKTITSEQKLVKCQVEVGMGFGSNGCEV